MLQCYVRPCSGSPSKSTANRCTHQNIPVNQCDFFDWIRKSHKRENDFRIFPHQLYITTAPSHRTHPHCAAPKHNFVSWVETFQNMNKMHGSSSQVYSTSIVKKAPQPEAVLVRLVHWGPVHRTRNQTGLDRNLDWSRRTTGHGSTMFKIGKPQKTGYTGLVMTGSWPNRHCHIFSYQLPSKRNKN
jgi:hypothetical protein